MGYLTKPEIFQRFLSDGRNSSHFVWLLADLRFFEASNGWIFAFKKIGSVTLLPLEPLIPVGDTESSFNLAWKEFSQAEKVQIASFVSVYSKFFQLLTASGFKGLKVGREPFVDLADCIPRGNTGKGVRSARNQALNAGLKVQEWKAQDLSRTENKAILEEIYKEWKARIVIQLSGFMNATDPFQYMEHRRYFVALGDEGKVEAFLVATPIPAEKGYFLEDLLMRADAPRGTGELLTLEAMVALQESGAPIASLGVVSATTIDEEAAMRLPAMVRFFLLTVPKYLRKFYNFDGLETYRKRFKPKFWNDIYLAIKVEQAQVSETRAWLKTLFALFIAFEPKPAFNLPWLTRTLVKPIRKYPITVSTFSISFALFAFVNRFGDIPDWALARFGFFGNAPIREWGVRSVVSDFLYFNPTHYCIWGTLLILVVSWAERTHKRHFLLTFMATVCVFDDYINYFVLIKPFEYFQPVLFSNLIGYKDVGGSLCLATLVGLQVCEFRLIREPLFALGTLVLTLTFAFTSTKLNLFIMNLNHIVFFILGFLVGKAKFEYMRAISRQASKQKPPEAKSVLVEQDIIPQPHEQKRAS